MNIAEKIYHYRLLALAGHFFFCTFLLFSPSLTFAKSPPSQDDYSPPPYSSLYDTVIELEQQGAFVEALRFFPKIYEVEIPVEAFYTTLDNKRNQLLKLINQGNTQFMVGDEKRTCADVLPLFKERFLENPDSYKKVAPISDDLSFDRFCNLLIVEGHVQHTASTGSLLIPSFSQFSLQSALDSADTWLVSAAIFFAQKQTKPTISPQAIIDRWERRPDLWDEVCTQQFLRIIAQLDSAEIKSLQISNEDIRLELGML